MKLSYAELSSHLEGAIEPVYLLAGDQELLRELAARKLQQAVVGESPSAFNFERFDGETATGDRILVTANTFPLLGGRRLVMVKRATRLLETDEAFASYLQDPSSHTVLVLDLDKKPDARRKGWKDVEKRVTVISCEAPVPAELPEWVSEEAKARGLRLGSEEIRDLVTELGSDLRRLLNELEKLSLYASGERLDLEIIADVLGRGRAQSIFKFTDAVAHGQVASALRQLGRLLEEGEAPLRILALLDRLVGQLRIAREVAASGRRNVNLASLLGAPHAAAWALADRARKLDERYLRRAVEALADTDRLLKSSRLPQRVVMESLVMVLAGGKASTKRGYEDDSRRASRDL